jgi:hypothetical protein
LLKKTGVVTVTVWLADPSDAALAQIKGLGFEVIKRNGSMKMLFGRIDASKLEQLSKLTTVKYIAPGPAPYE